MAKLRIKQTVSGIGQSGAAQASAPGARAQASRQRRGTERLGLHKGNGGEGQAPGQCGDHRGGEVSKVKLSELAPARGAVKRSKRKGLGSGSGHGKRSTRGNKGQRARNTVNIWFEGGQMPLQRRIPKRGFKNVLQGGKPGGQPEPDRREVRRRRRSQPGDPEGEEPGQAPRPGQDTREPGRSESRSR